MIPNPLSAETVSLIHHVELNESGWWKKALGQVVQSALWQLNKTVDIGELQAKLKEDLYYEVANDRLLAQLDILSAQGAVTTLAKKYKLTETKRAELTAAKAVADKEQQACEDVFIANCKKHCPILDAEATYAEFRRCLQRTIQVSGANLFHLLVDGQLERDVDWVDPFLSKYSQSCQEGLRKTLAAFFSPSNEACRSHVLRLISAHFFAESSQLKSSTLAAIEGQRKKRTIKVVLDTNFLFSILKLHDNPGDDSALSLVEITERTGKNFEIVLYVLPSTLDEVQRVLTSQIRLVEHIRTSRAMSRAALSQPLPSIAKKFLDAATKAPGLSAETFFRPYVEDIRSVLEGKGIKILDANPAIYNFKQDVIDDVLTEMDREVLELPEAKRKGYETLLHDAVLWHAVKDRRSTNDHSPFDVEYWAVTIDWRLISFDRQKRSAKGSGLPLVLHPSSLIQLLQFWIPRSADLDDVLVDSLRMSLYFQSFDAEDEKVTVKILESISRFENVGDFTETTIKVMLTNQALRGRLKNSSASNEEVFEYVREELISLHNAAVHDLGVVSEDLKAAGEKLEQERQSRLAALRDLEAVSGNLSGVSEELAAERRDRLAVQTQLSQSTQAESLATAKVERLEYSMKMIWAPLALCLILISLAYLITTNYVQTWISLPFVTSIGIGCIPLLVALLVSAKMVDAKPNLAAWRPASSMSRVGKRAGALIALTIGAIFSGAVWDLCKYWAGFS
ncbi:hypothetical protein [Pseudomonas japonica]|uniref:hypothetical protein n=1 Tax=Pseudomonas japonica TaxID=256466 RepID=UPI0015E48449|nr:hypothetical protein [Pseudomonas japonica]MBA1245550.1 hypothetical protein [Pseudomonas japonica]